VPLRAGSSCVTRSARCFGLSSPPVRGLTSAAPVLLDLATSSIIFFFFCFFFFVFFFFFFLFFFFFSSSRHTCWADCAGARRRHPTSGLARAAGSLTTPLPRCRLVRALRQPLTMTGAVLARRPTWTRAARRRTVRTIAAASSSLLLDALNRSPSAGVPRRKNPPSMDRDRRPRSPASAARRLERSRAGLARDHLPRARAPPPRRWPSSTRLLAALSLACWRAGPDRDLRLHLRGIWPVAVIGLVARISWRSRVRWPGLPHVVDLPRSRESRRSRDLARRPQLAYSLTASNPDVRSTHRSPAAMARAITPAVETYMSPRGRANGRASSSCTGPRRGTGSCAGARRRAADRFSTEAIGVGRLLRVLAIAVNDRKLARISSIADGHPRRAPSSETRQLLHAEGDSSGQLSCTDRQCDASTSPDRRPRAVLDFAADTRPRSPRHGTGYPLFTPDGRHSCSRARPTATFSSTKSGPPAASRTASRTRTSPTSGRRLGRGSLLAFEPRCIGGMMVVAGGTGSRRKLTSRREPFYRSADARRAFLVATRLRPMATSSS